MDGLIQVSQGWFGSNLWAISLALVIGLVAIFALVNVNALLMVWVERKVSGHIQNRIGPQYLRMINSKKPLGEQFKNTFGLHQTLFDGIKLLLKEDIANLHVDKLLFVMAPAIVFVGAFASFVPIPFSETFSNGNLDIGVLYILAMSSFGVIGILMAGWAGNNKYSLYGAIRSAAQMVSYEIPIALCILAGILTAGTLNMNEIVHAQAGGFWKWFISPLSKAGIFNLVAFVLYIIASLAETNRVPFDIPEAESELVAGFHTEYTGMKWAIFFLSEYANMFIVASIAVTLFLGGWQPPIDALGFIPGVFWFFLKIAVLLLFIVIVRWTLPRFRVDQMMELCWKAIIPLTFVNLLAASLWVLNGWGL